MEQEHLGILRLDRGKAMSNEMEKGSQEVGGK